MCYLFLLMIIFCSCSSDYESAFIYHWEEENFVDGYILKMRSDMSYENGMIKAFLDSETGDGSMSNLSIGNLGCKATAYGIDIDLYLENLDAVGFHWFDTPFGAVEHYRIYYTKNGYFKIDYVDEKRNYKSVKSIPPEKSNIKLGEFNNIKMRTCDSGNVEFYVNRKLVLTMKRNELQLGIGRFLIAYRTENKMNYTKENTGIAYFKINSEQF